MSTVSAADMIGHTLVASQPVIAYSGHPKSNVKKTIPKGAIIGTVYSWVKDPDNAANVYWMFQEKYGNVFSYVRHDVNKLELSKSDSAIETNEERLAKEAEAKKKEEMGVIPYYIERYGKPILFFASAALAVRAYAASRKK